MGAQEFERSRRDPFEGHLGHAATEGRARREGVVEGLADPALDPLLAVERNRPTGRKTERPQVIKAVDMIDVVVRVEDGINPADPFAKQLVPKVGRGVDQQVATRKAEKDARPGSNVPWIAAGARLAAAADERHPGARAGAQEEQPTGHVATNAEWRPGGLGMLDLGGRHEANERGRWPMQRLRR